MAQTATSYYRGIFKPPSSPNGVQNQGCIADVTGASAPTVASSVTYTPMTATGVDALYIDDQVLTVSFNTSPTQTVTDITNVLQDGVTVGSSTASAGLVGTMSKLLPGVGHYHPHPHRQGPRDGRRWHQCQGSPRQRSRRQS